MVRRAQAALRSVEHTSVRQLRVLAAIVFLFAMVIATVAPAVTAPMAFADSSTSSSSVDYATWAEVSKAMDKQLNSGLETYKDGNTAGATSDFMGAYNKIYVASNFTAVVHDTIGADKQLAQQQAFQSRYVRRMWNTAKSVPGKSAIQSVKLRAVPEYLLPGDLQIQAPAILQ